MIKSVLRFMIDHFPKNPALNNGGLAKFEFVPLYNILSIPNSFNQEVVTPIQLKPGKTFFQGYATLESLSFEENAEKLDHGTSYSRTISGFIPGNKKDLAELMNDMEKQRFVVIIHDFDSQKRMVTMLEFTSKFKSGERRSDAKGYTFQFTGESSLRAPYYNV